MTRFATISDAAEALRKEETTPIELVGQCLAAVDRREAELRAWVFVEREQALEEAERLACELTNGHDRGPLHGIPIGVKDVYDVADWPTAAGSVRWTNAIARDDCPVVARLREAGAIFLGKTVTTAFAGFDPPVTRNPWNGDRTPGGSSSGSAAALATEMCFGALGSQTGGSLTRPASYCGVAACKPTFGLLPLTGIVPVAPSLDHPGPMARCVRDLRLMLQAMATISLSPSESRPVRLLRIRGMFERLAEPSVTAAMDEVVDRFRSQGLAIEEATLPKRFDDVLERHLSIMAHEAAEWHRDRFRRHADDYPPKARELIERGLAGSDLWYAACKQHQHDLSGDMDAFLRSTAPCILLTPATTGVAPAADTTGKAAFNAPWSYVGLPTVSFPTGQFFDGLPLAIQLVGARHADAELLDVAEELESRL